MKSKIALSLVPSLLLIQLLFSTSTAAASTGTNQEAETIGELNPFDSQIEEELNFNDSIYGDSSATFFETPAIPYVIDPMGSCYRESCAVWAYVSRSRQSITIFVNGEEQDTWPVSTGVSGHDTPAFDTHPNGRIYDAYSSTKYPGGDYKGLGNMPYVVFIRGGFAIHGTPQGNWRSLGRRASHGCIRVHPDVAYYFNRLVRNNGVRNTWVTVQ